MTMNRMFHVIVVGGVSLVGHACGSAPEKASSEATSGGTATSTSTSTSSEGFGGFPTFGGPPVVDAGSDAPTGDGSATDAGDGAPPWPPIEVQ
jgi:hypothetical protein